MKRFYYLATALLVLAGAAGCKKNADVQEPESKGNLRHISITAGQGTAKTYVVGGQLLWSAGDVLNIVPKTGSADDVAALGITSGVGENVGKFEGDVLESIGDDTPLYGWCGGSWSFDGSFAVSMPSTQTYVENGLAENAYPSIGSGAIKGGISLNNPFGILCLNLKGTSADKVKDIVVTSVANNLAGAFVVDPGTLAVTAGSSKTVTMSCPSEGVELSAKGVKFYIILPPASYSANDLSIVATDLDDETFEYTFTSAVEITSSNAFTKELDALFESKNAPVCTSAPWSGLKTTLDANGKTLWSGSDVVKIYSTTAASGNDYQVQSGAGTEVATLDGILKSGSKPFYAIYPASAALGISGSVISFALPATQTYSAGSFVDNTVVMVASSENYNLQFSNTCGMLKIGLKGDCTISSISVTSASAYLSGTFTADPANNPQAVYSSGGSKSVTLSCGSGVSVTTSGYTYFNIALPVGNYSDLTIKVTDTSSNQYTLTTSSVNIDLSSVTTIEETLKSTVDGVSVEGIGKWN